MGSVVVCAVIGLAIRVVAASGDPWLDEIWSWQIARSGEVLVAHDNNHLLNTLWLWICRETPAAILWRLPAVLCGTATIVMSAVVLRRLGRVHAVCGALLMAVSHPMVVYQSEARGYAMMLLCVLVAIELQLRLIEAPPTRRARIAMALVALAGVLSHLSFAVVYGILIATSVAMRWQDRRTELVRRTLVEHGVGLVGVALWLATFGRQMSVGGGPELDALGVLAQTLQSISGAAVLTPVVLIVCAVLAFGQNRRLVLLLGAVTLAYPMAIWLLKDRLVYVRYFLPMIAVATLLIGAGIGQLLTRPRLRIMAGGYLALLICLHATSLIPLLVAGRDQHRTALARIAMDTHSGTTIASDADFQLRTILAYHDRTFGTCAKPLVLPPDAAAHWWVAMRRQGPEQITRSSETYTLRGSYNAHSLSGIPWLVYERADREASRFDWRSAQTYAE